MEMDYYYTTAENEARGPVSIDELRSLLQSGVLNASTKVAAVGSQSWVPINSVVTESPAASVAPQAPPVGQTTSAGPTYSSAPTTGGPAAYPVQQTVAPTDPLAIWSLVLSLLGLFCCGFFAGIPAIILGHMSLGKLKREPHIQGRGLAIAGLCIGYFATLFWLAYLFLMGGLAFFSALVEGTR